MSRFLAGLLSLTVLAGWAGAQEVRVRSPIGVGAGQGVYLRAPIIRVAVPPVPIDEPPTVPVPVPQPVPPPPAPPTTQVPPGSTQALCLSAFVATYRPCAGNHELTLIHPFTGAPVRVQFSLPCTPRRVMHNRRVLEFDCGHCTVTVRFWRTGKVSVRS